MSLLSQFIEKRTPKFNKFMVEGYCYHKLKNAVDYIDRFIRYTIDSKTNTYLTYKGYREIDYKEEASMMFSTSMKTVCDISTNDLYLVEFIFQYADEPTERRYTFYIPFLRKGNLIKMSGKDFLIMPTLADKVVSVGNKIVFINIATAKYNFNRKYHTVIVDGKGKNISIIKTELYKNQSKKHDATTKAAKTVMHYLLGAYGYTGTMMKLLGFVPKVVYDAPYDPNTVVIESSGLPPKEYIRPKDTYTPTRIKFVVDRSIYNEEISYVLGNVLYIIDNFPDIITIDNLDNTYIWQRILGEIILSGNYTINYIMDKIIPHYRDLESPFDVIVINKLSDIGITARSLMELMVVIFKNYNTWTMNEDVRSLYYNKTFESESYILSEITSRITKTVLDISKDEMKIAPTPLPKAEVDKIFNKYFKQKAIFKMKQDKQYKFFVTSVDYPGDHLYPKYSAIVSVQESDFVNKDKKSVNAPEKKKKKLIASMATVGSILSLTKNNPTPLIRMNPYINIDYKTGTVLPPQEPEYQEIIERTDRLLASQIEELIINNEELETIDEEDYEYEEDDVEEEGYTPDASDEIDVD